MRCTSSGTVGDPAERADDRRAEGQIGNEVPVHDVHVDPLRAAGDGALDLLAQPAEIGAQDAGGDAHASRRPPGPRLTTRSTAATRAAGRPRRRAGWRAPRLAPGRRRRCPPEPTRTPAAARICARLRHGRSRSHRARAPRGSGAHRQLNDAVRLRAPCRAADPARSRCPAANESLGRSPSSAAGSPARSAVAAPRLPAAPAPAATSDRLLKSEPGDSQNDEIT